MLQQSRVGKRKKGNHWHCIARFRTRKNRSHLTRSQKVVDEGKCGVRARQITEVCRDRSHASCQTGEPMYVIGR